MRSLQKKRNRALPNQRVLELIRGSASFRAGDRVGVAVSGGADSVALLFLLLEVRESLGIVLSVVHFNHKLREKASDSDEKFVGKLAESLGVPFYVAHADVAAKAKREKANLEDAGRRARYEFFDELVAEGHLTRIATAHTADDQAETVLAHILRGTGLAGVSGIHPITGNVVRPLLGARRSELRFFLQSRKQKWREDTSNQDTTRTRAKIRKNLIPLLEKQFQPLVVEHLVTLADLAREDEAFLDGLASERISILIKEDREGLRIGIENLLHPIEGSNGLPIKIGEEEKNPVDAIRNRIVRQIVERTKSGDGQISAPHVAAVVALAKRGENGKTLELPGGVRVRRERNTLFFLAVPNSSSLNINKNPGKTTTREFAYNIDLVEGETHVKVVELGCAFRLTEIDWLGKRGETSKTGTVLDRDRLLFPLVLRNWRPGDTFRPSNHRNAHKLKRLLNEKRISRWERDGWPVVTSGGTIVWVRGFLAGAEFVADERTRTGIVIAEEKTL